MIIKIAGLPGVKTQQAIINIEEAVASSSSTAEVEWINDVYQIMQMGPIRTPSMFINDELKASGRIPSVHEVKTWITQAQRN